LLTTPASNVVDVKGTKTGYSAAGLVLIGTGLIVGALGAYALKARDDAEPAQRGLLLGTGVAGLIAAAGLGLGGTALVLTPPRSAEAM
jgi:hypothetical protein